jgi:hypothetical protein
MRRLIYLCIVLLAGLSQSEARSLTIKIIDESGAAFPEVLVIVRSLNHTKEIARYLSDANGQIPSIALMNEPVQIIATCPYGLCETTVREFLGSTVPDHLILSVPIHPTDEQGELVDARTVRIIFDSVRQPDTTETSVDLLVRDSSAERQKWYRTDSSGTATIEILGNPTVIVAFWKGGVFQFSLEESCNNGSPTLGCIPIDGGIVHLDIKNAAQLRD